LIFGLFVWSLTAGLYVPVFITLYKSRWETIDYTHAYFILPLSLYFVWRARHKYTSLAENLPVFKGFWPLFWLVSGLSLFIFAWKQDYLFLSTLSLIPVLCGLTCYLYGKKVFQSVAFPIFYLLFLVPPPLGVLDEITVPMRYGVSVTTELVLKMLGYPLSRQGLMLFVGSHEVFLGAACSGFRSLITLASLGSAYIYLTQGSLSKKIGMAAAIVPLALLGNLMRVVSVCIATYYLGESKGWRLFHDASGFLMFSVMIGGLLGVERIFEKIETGTR